MQVNTGPINNYRSLADFIGNTPLVRLTRLPGIGNNTLLAKLEGNNPAGSVKDRPAYSMIRRRKSVVRSNPAIPSSKRPAATPASHWPWLQQ